MEIEIDYNPKPKRMFFISVSVSKKAAISFDRTSKGHRIIKQVLVKKQHFPKNEKISAEWDAIVIKNKKFVKKYHVKWIDKGKRDQVNNELWETIWAKPISKALAGKLLRYSWFIAKNYKNLKKSTAELKKYEEFLAKEVKKYAEFC